MTDQFANTQNNVELAPHLQAWNQALKRKAAARKAMRRVVREHRDLYEKYLQEELQSRGLEPAHEGRLARGRP